MKRSSSSSSSSSHSCSEVVSPKVRKKSSNDLIERLPFDEYDFTLALKLVFAHQMQRLPDPKELTLIKYYQRRKSCVHCQRKVRIGENHTCHQCLPCLKCSKQTPWNPTYVYHPCRVKSRAVSAFCHEFHSLYQNDDSYSPLNPFNPLIRMQFVWRFYYEEYNDLLKATKMSRRIRNRSYMFWLPEEVMEDVLNLTVLSSLDLEIESFYYSEQHQLVYLNSK